MAKKKCGFLNLKPLIGVKILLDIAGISNGFFDINIPNMYMYCRQRRHNPGSLGRQSQSKLRGTFQNNINKRYIFF